MGTVQLVHTYLESRDELTVLVLQLVLIVP